MVLELITTPNGPAIMLTATDESEITTLTAFAVAEQELTTDIIYEPQIHHLHILIRRPKP